MSVSPDFGSTIAIMAQDSPTEITKECLTSNQLESLEAHQRAVLFEFALDYLNLSQETTTGCARTLLSFMGANGQVNSFWDIDPDQQDRCKIV